MWFIGVEVEQETSAPPPKKILDPPLGTYKNQHYCSRRDTASVHTAQKKVIDTQFFCKGEKTHNADL